MTERFWTRLALPSLLVLAVAVGTPALQAQEAAPEAAATETIDAADAVTEAADAPVDADGAEQVAVAEAEIAADAAAEEAPVEHAPIPFFSLYNTNFVVLLAFLAFVAVLLYLKVPGTLGGLLDKRAQAIRKELEDARHMREEAQTLLASYDRKQKEVHEQAERIVAAARSDAQAAAEKAREQLAHDIERRLQAAEDQIASARAAAIREVRNRAAELAVEVAGEQLAAQMSAARANALVEEAIEQVTTRLN